MKTQLEIDRAAWGPLKNNKSSPQKIAYVNNKSCQTNTEPEIDESTTILSRKSKDFEDNVSVKYALYVIFSITGSSSKVSTLKWKDSDELQHAKSLLKLVKEMSVINQTQFQEMVEKLNLEESNCSLVFKGVAEEVLQGDSKGITWSRIAILFTFASFMAKYCQKEASEEFLDTFGFSVGKFIEQRTSSWVASQGGWALMAAEPKRPITEYLLGAAGIGTTVITAFFTVLSFGHSTGAFTSFLKG